MTSSMSVAQQLAHVLDVQNISGPRIHLLDGGEADVVVGEGKGGGEGEHAFCRKQATGWGGSFCERPTRDRRMFYCKKEATDKNTVHYRTDGVPYTSCT